MYFEDYMPKARFIGEIVGQLSVALSKVDVITNQANIFKSAKEWAIPALVGKMDLPKSFVEMYEKEFGEIYESLPQQVIHRDPNPGNIIICGENWGVLDFDLSERNIRIFDPCYAATAIPYVIITNQLISTAWFSGQEKYRDLYETNKKMTEWMLLNFNNMLVDNDRKLG